MEQDILIESYIENLYIVEDFQYLDEGVKEILNKLTPNVVKDLVSKIKNHDVSSFIDTFKKHGLKMIPDKKTKDHVIKAAKNLPKEIQDGALYANKVISNSIVQASPRSKWGASYFISVLTKIKNPKQTNLIPEIKNQLRTFIPKVQSFYEDFEQKANEQKRSISTDDLADMAMAVGTIIALASVGALTVILVTKLLSMLMMFAGILLSLSTVVIIIGLVGAGVYLKQEIFDKK